MAAFTLKYQDEPSISVFQLLSKVSTKCINIAKLKLIPDNIFIGKMSQVHFEAVFS